MSSERELLDQEVNIPECMFNSIGAGNIEKMGRQGEATHLTQVAPILRRHCTADSTATRDNANHSLASRSRSQQPSRTKHKRLRLVQRADVDEKEGAYARQLSACYNLPLQIAYTFLRLDTTAGFFWDVFASTTH